MKVKTNISPSLIGRVAIYISDVCQVLKYCRNCFYRQHHNVFDVTLNDNFHQHSQFVDTENISE